MPPVLSPPRVAEAAHRSRRARLGIAGGRGPCWPLTVFDVGEHAAGVPGGEGSYQRRGPVEFDAAVARGLGPGELAGVPFDEGFGIRRDEEVLVEAGVRLADLGLSELDEQPIALTVRAAREVEADDDASIRQTVPAQRVAHRPQGHEGIEVLRGD